MNHKRGNAYEGSGRTPEGGAETAAEEVFAEVEDAETRLPGDERDDKKDGEAADTLTPSPTAQENVQHDKGDSRTRNKPGDKPGNNPGNKPGTRSGRG
ncbi:hypothetical protein GCM10010252_29530 [Streptomyces aureoverticillatus]|nr:hypothetical protein GCM10010252_29530 [Streptomyces aureoverticillatus]